MRRCMNSQSVSKAHWLRDLAELLRVGDFVERCFVRYLVRGNSGLNGKATALVNTSSIGKGGHRLVSCPIEKTQ